MERSRLPVAPGSAPIACPRSTLLSEEEIDIARRIRAVKIAAARARQEGDRSRLSALRSEFARLATERVRARREKYQRLGHLDVD